jgi:RHS repeat-associated protein
VTRGYAFDANDNRLTRTTIPAAADGSCAAAGGTTVTRTFDTADRPTSGSYVYDALGRTLTLPATDAPRPANGSVSLTYYDNDLARSISQGGIITTFTLDALDRRGTETVVDASGTTVTVRRYTDASDNPTWITQGGATRRYAELIGNDLALTVDGAGHGELTIANLHGDVVSTVDIATAASTATALAGWNWFDEYGIPAATNDADTGEVDYGWLGARQRAVSGAGLILMGVRLYNPVTGLFTSVDPVDGGNANAYTYPSDSINLFDLDGRMYKSERRSRWIAHPRPCKTKCKIKKWLKKYWPAAKEKGLRIVRGHRCGRSIWTWVACAIIEQIVQTYVQRWLSPIYRWAKRKASRLADGAGRALRWGYHKFKHRQRNLW